MDPPFLKLILLQGPREGETLEFGFGSTVRIGRVVRGNNLAIKDVGISSKHLTIQSVPESNKWVLTDLDSSNGTFLNSTKLPPHTPSDLKDGDTVKLGELTSVMIKIGGGEGEGRVESRRRRNPRRAANAGYQKVEMKTVEAENAAELDQWRDDEESRLQRNPRRKVPSKNCKIKVEIESEDGSEDNRSPEKKPHGKPPRCGERVGRVTRSRSQKDEVVSIEPEKAAEVENKTRGVGAGRGRGRGRRRNLKSEEVNLKEESQVEVVEAENMREEIQIQVSDNEGNGNNDKNVDVVGENGIECEDKAQGRVRGNLRGKEPQIEVVSKDEGNDKVEVIRDYDDEDAVASQQKVDDAGDREVRNDVKAGDGNGFDFEKMTLGEWFEYLKVHLAKQIFEETEEMIEEMRRKAERVKAYIIEQKMKEKEKEKGKCR